MVILNRNNCVSCVHCLHRTVHLKMRISSQIWWISDHYIVQRKKEKKHASLLRLENLYPSLKDVNFWLLMKGRIRTCLFACCPKLDFVFFSLMFGRPSRICWGSYFGVPVQEGLGKGWCKLYFKHSVLSSFFSYWPGLSCSLSSDHLICLCVTNDFLSYLFFWLAIQLSKKTKQIIVVETKYLLNWYFRSTRNSTYFHSTHYKFKIILSL